MKFKIAMIALLATTSAFAGAVKVVTHIEYLEKTTGQMKTHHEEQNLSVTRFSMDSFSSMKTITHFVLNERRSDGRPLMMSISNAMARLQGDQVPHINLPFSFFEKSIRKDHTYICTENYSGKDECRVQLIDSIVFLGIPSGKSVCKVKVSSPDPLDFSSTTSGPISDALAFPSIVDEKVVDGLSFAMSFDCTNSETGQNLLNGYFLHNTDQAPTLE